MEQSEFRKLNVELPVEPINNEYPWSIAGWVLAIVFVIIITSAFLRFKGII